MYNFGATMYRLTTLRLPPCVVKEAGSPAITSKVWQNMLKPVRECNPSIPPEVAELIHRCLSFQPDSRPERMSDVQETLNRLVEKLAAKHEDQLDTLDW
jgi:serine/threonine protein kinase